MTEMRRGRPRPAGRHADPSAHVRLGLPLGFQTPGHLRRQIHLAASPADSRGHILEHEQLVAPSLINRRVRRLREAPAVSALTQFEFLTQVALLLRVRWPSHLTGSNQWTVTMNTLWRPTATLT